MAEPTKDLEKLREEQAKDDVDVLADLDRESKEFDKASYLLAKQVTSKAKNSQLTKCAGLRD